MKTAKIGNVTLESGKVKIAIPVMGMREEDVLSDAVLVKQENPDLVEWRADLFFSENGLENYEIIFSTAKKLRIFLEETPLLFTIRTREEGGNADISPESYEEIIRCIAERHLADAVDIEFLKFEGQDYRLRQLIGDVKRSGVTVILSSHDFYKTPSVEEMVKRLKDMEYSGADIAKIAVMPMARQDVMNLINATFNADMSTNIPLITMSMGEMGRASRLVGEVTGSCITFASKRKASAPGQIPVEKLRGLFNQ